MGRPLRKEYTKDITVHCYETDGTLISSKLTKQIGFNTYVSTNGVAIKLGEQAAVTAEGARKAGTGYVVVNAESTDHSLFKLTKNLILCTDGNSYPFEYTLTTDATGTVTGLTQASTATAKLEGLYTTYYTYTITPTPDDATVTLTATGCTQSGNSITVPAGTSVSWSVSKTGYVTQSGTKTVNSTSEDEITLVAE